MLYSMYVKICLRKKNSSVVISSNELQLSYSVFMTPSNVDFNQKNMGMIVKVSGIFIFQQRDQKKIVRLDTL